MKKLTLFSALLLCSVMLMAQQKTEVYTFTVVKENPITSVKNQNSTGTCWSFSGLGFLESELIRQGKGTYDLSEMYIVRKNYEDKAKKYTRLHGSLNFGPGGSFADVVESIDDYGLVPNSVYTGLNYGSDTHNHNEMDKVLSAYIKGIAESNSLTTAWFNGFSGILDAYLGKTPDTFTYEGKQYTPQSFAKMLGLNQNDYVSITSFTHHPFYTKFAIEVPDNWRWANSYNLPLDELIETIDNAINNGYTVAWASDVSEAGFSREGIAIVPDENAPENIGSDQAKWLGLSPREKSNALRDKIGKEMLKEKTITQEMRQEAFDNFQTTDDHGMQIYGIAKDQNGNKYYMVKNSWGETGPYKGIWYVSEPFVRYKTLSAVVNKKALPASVSKKLGL
ncbi:MAG TPA: C1 family peptidase [Dysgonamonadaceae bacterium]|nr:aminopeptidase [Dysgonamonadaceae bacterium]HOM63925.1 C1 family peptidase [Dysgonamonadaceae bacterium]HOV36661.1 C1 family peptidase [Dysgonamonadaceae bacterium]HPD43510.1 C1 family peptidase [Dysgonamonadaceae bacterium]HQG08920.1 C1 family peptidase [Dysgonamonadaceae bacterium]